MRFDTSQHMRLGQQMKLAPRMIQSMEILQMPLNELEERIEQELESNATLEVAEREGDRRKLQEQALDREREARENERPLTVDEQRGSADFERLESFESANPDVAENQYAAPAEREWEPTRTRARLDGERDGKMDAMAAAPARAAPLVDQLLDQWRLADVPDELRPPGELILSYIEDDGYLRTPLEVIADRAPAGGGPGAASAGQKPPVELLRRALGELQRTLEPPGTAARDVRESLLLQIDAILGGPRDDGRFDPVALKNARLLIEHHLDDLMQNRLPRIAEKTGLTLDEIKAALEQMRRLSLAPARQLVTEAAGIIVPDAIVEYDEEHDRYIAYLNDSRLPNLRINREYAELARDKAAPKRDRDFLKTNISNAQWLIDAVNQRKHTLLRVINVVVDAQRDYFDYGPQALKPLPMTQVAEQLGIHVATVSRAVADKYIQTPRGVVPLRKFFTGGFATEGGEDVSYDAVRAALQEVIAAEDKSKPLSDEAIVEELKKKGIEIARRTVAKYRDQLGIPSARLRKTF
jgi:RNA polymerase sigma-54 factor